MELELVRRCAEISVHRGLGFALLAVGCLMLGFAFDVGAALLVGACCLLIICTILYFRSLAAPTRDYRKTETWILLGKQVDLPPERLQRAIGSVLQDLYRRYARWLLCASVVLWLGSLISRIV